MSLLGRQGERGSTRPSREDGHAQYHLGNLWCELLLAHEIHEAAESVVPDHEVVKILGDQVQRLALPGRTIDNRER